MLKGLSPSQVKLLRELLKVNREISRQEILDNLRSEGDPISMGSLNQAISRLHGTLIQSRNLKFQKGRGRPREVISLTDLGKALIHIL